jgi:hypothetical protein
LELNQALVEFLVSDRRQIGQTPLGDAVGIIDQVGVEPLPNCDAFLDAQATVLEQVGQVPACRKRAPVDP